MKKLVIIWVQYSLIILLLITSPVFAFQYCKDVLETGNPGGWSGSLKTFDEEVHLQGSDTLVIDIWLNDLRGNVSGSPDRLISSGFEATLTENLSVVSLIPYTTLQGGPWDPLMQSIEFYDNSVSVVVASFGCPSLDSDNDMIIAKLEIQYNGLHNGQITFRSIPGFDTTVSCSGDEYVYDPDVVPNEFTIIGPECITNTDCDDGIYCDGAEICEDGTCVEGTNPCPNDGNSCTEDCDEMLDTCYVCNALNTQDPCCADPICENEDVCLYETSEYYVDGTTGSNTNDGLSPATAWKTITYALSQVNGTDNNHVLIHVAPATYTTTMGGGDAETFPLIMKNYVSLQGAGYDVTVINANQTGSVIKSEQKDNYTIEGFTITGGRAFRGGGFDLRFSSPTISKCSIVGNTALEVNGGGIYCKQSSPIIVNCVIANNSAVNQNGGGISCGDHSSPTILNCTIVGNAARGDSIDYGGGALYIGNLSAPTITNCILWNNYPDEIYVKDAPTPSVTYSCIDGGYTGNGNISADPQFAEVTNYRLAYNSPCIDSANSTGASVTDIEGNGRYDAITTDNTGVGPFAYYDRGAYEYQGDTDGDGIMDNGDNSEVIGDHPCTGGATENCDDNCLYIFNPPQEDFDGDGVGDVCDPDDDSDGICDPGESDPSCTGSDNCPYDYNPDQSDLDGDGLGNVCDPDDDSDGICDPGESDPSCTGSDNCPYDYNPDQSDLDGDGLGNVCDICPSVYNPDQLDSDEDGIGNVCDNCPSSANGPDMGTCVAINDGSIGGICTDKDDCEAGEFCSMNQEDRDSDKVGDACDSCTECRADFENDGDVDGTDTIKFKQDYGRRNCTQGNPCNGDFDCDGDLDGSDVFVFKQNFGRKDCPACGGSTLCEY